MTTAKLELKPEQIWTEPRRLDGTTREAFRYEFSWTWGTGPIGLFVGINPSNGSADRPDPTMRKMRGFATRWGWGGFMIANPFAFRTDDPKDLRCSPSMTKFAIGTHNDWHIDDMIKRADVLVACWGVLHPAFYSRVAKVHNMLEESGKKVMCLGMTKDRYPKHPLYLPFATELEVFKA